MISLEVEVCDGFFICGNENCKRSTQYNYCVFGTTHYIKQGTICASIQVNNSREYYCRDCIGEIYNLIKSKLDSKLWAFG